jgi:hypothetical protein
MKLFKLERWQLTASEEAWGLLPFKAILDRDDDPDKQQAMKEMLFIYYFADVKSDYMHMDEEDRVGEIKNDVGLAEDWEVDETIKVAIDFYKDRSQSIIEQLYTKSLKAASDIGDYLANTKELLYERDNNGRPVNDISKITNAVQKVPKLMADLKSAYKEVVKEQEDNENKTKGSRTFNTFEEGFGDEAVY